MYSPIRTGMPMATMSPPTKISAVNIDIIEPKVNHQTPDSNYLSASPYAPMYGMPQSSIYGQPPIASQNNIQQGLMYGQPPIAQPYNIVQGSIYGQPPTASQYNMPQATMSGLPAATAQQQIDPKLQQTLEMLQKQMSSVQDKMSNIATTFPFAHGASTMTPQQQGSLVTPTIPNIVGPTLVQSGPQIVPAQPQPVSQQAVLTPPPIPSPGESQVGQASSQIVPATPEPTLSSPPIATIDGTQAGQITPQVATPSVNIPAPPAPVPTEISSQQQVVQPPTQQAAQIDETAKANSLQTEEAMDVDKIVNLLTSEDADEKTVGIQKIAELGQVKSKESEALLNEKVFKSLHDIVTKDTNPKPNETPEQKDVREKDHVNKMIGMWTLAILMKNFRESMNEEAQKQGIQDLSLNELPEIVSIVNNVKNDADPTIRAAGISALKYLATPKDHDPLSTIFEIALKQDVDPGVKITAIDALMTIAQPQDAQKYAKLFNSEIVNADSSMKSAKDPNAQQALATLKDTAQKAVAVLADSIPQDNAVAQKIVNSPQDQGQESWKIPAYRPGQEVAQ